MSNNLMYDEFFSMGKGVLTYPSLLVEDYDEQALPVVLSSIFVDDGELPVMIKYKGKIVKLGMIRKTPLQIKTLIRMCKVAVATGEGIMHSVSSIEEVLELEDFVWTR